MVVRTQTGSGAPLPPLTLSKPWSSGSLLPSSILLLAAGPVPGAEEQASGDQVELHAAAEVLPEQHRAHLRGLHLCPAEAAGLRGGRPGQARVGALRHPECNGGLQEKVSLHCSHPTWGPGERYINNLGSVSPSRKWAP